MAIGITSQLVVEHDENTFESLAFYPDPEGPEKSAAKFKEMMA